MTEKRFKKLVSSIDYYDIWDTVKEKGYVAEDLANALYEENEQLKHQLQQQEMEYATTCNRLAEENERLKQQLRIFSEGLKSEIRETKEVFEDYSECVDEKLELKKENKQLKDFIRKEFPKSHKHILEGFE